MALEEHAELVVKTKNGESYTIAESRIVKGSLTASSSCSSGGGIPAGACNIGTASVAFRAPSGLTYKKLYRATVEIYAWYQGYSKELYGTYNVSSAENNYGVYTLSLSDDISLLDESCYAANDTENAENWLYSQMAGRWNVPSVILNYICNAYNVPHYNAAENEKFVPDSGNTALSTGVSSECSVESVKDFANYLAEYLGCFIVAAPDGRVRFSRLGEREYKTELNKSNISRGTLQRSPYYVHPSVWKVSFDSGYGSSWYVSSDLPDDAAPLSINITNNPFWQVQEDRVPADIYGGKVTQMIKYMWDYLYNAAVKKDGNTVEYMINPFSCTVHVPYHFRIGDIVTVRDYVNGDVFRSYLTDITWTFRGGQQISCAGDDTRTLSVGTSRSAAKKSNDYSKYLYRKSKTGSSGGDTNTYTKAEIDAKDGTIQAAADKAQATADGAVSVNNTQNTQISALQKSAHSHSNKDVLDKIEQPYTTAERDKLAGLENYTHPTYTAHTKGFYKFASDGEGHVEDAEKVTESDIYNAGGVIKNFLNFADYTGHMPIAFMSTGTSGSFGDYAKFIVDTRETSVSKMFMLSIGGNGVEGSLMLNGQNGSEYVIFPNSNSFNSNRFHFFLPDKSGTVALIEDIPDITVKQDKLTAGTNITISGNTISAKDTTYGNASASVAGLMSAEDKTSLDSMSLLHLNVGGSTNFVGVKFKVNRVSARFMVMENNGERADIYISIRIGVDTKAKVYVSGNTNSEYKVFYDNLDYVYVIFNCQLWSYIVCTSTVRIENMIEWRGTSYPTGLTGISMDIQILLDTGNYINYALAKDGTAVAAAKLSTARKINTIAFDGTADIVIPRSTKYMNASSGTGGQTGYVKVATFTVKSQYTNMPTVVRYRNRHTMPVELIFRFKNQSRVDPELEFILQVVELTGYGYKEAYLYKSATSTWDLIIAKSEAWDSVQILDCQQADGVSVAFENTHVSTVPSTAIKATVYTRAMVTSTVAAAKTLTDSGWVAVSNFSVNTSSFSQITTSFRKYGDIIFIRGRVQPKSNMTSISLCSTASTSLTGITPSHSVHGVGVSSDGLAPFSVNVTTSPANSVILKGNFLADKIYDFEFSYMK